MELPDKIVIGMLICGILISIKLYWGEYSYNRLPAKRVECCLMNNYPQEGEACRTVWHCKEYGMLTSQDRELYENCRERMTLHIRHSKYDTRIVGFDRE